MDRHPFHLLAMASCLSISATAFADVEIETSPVRDYQLPGSLELSNALIQRGVDGSTVIAKTVGTDPADASCGLVLADDTGARLVEYRYAGASTQCIGALPHPDGGVFVRGSDPTAVEDEVTGFTAFIGPDDQEAWSVPDQQLVDAAPEPNGPGEFQGAYEAARGAMAYSPELDKLLAFTDGRLTIGQEVKFISQAHVTNVGSGRVSESGQTFGLSGVGSVGGATTRTSDGHFIIYYFSSGDQGAFFYDYDGRTNIEFFKPRGEDWDDRFVARMIYTNDLLHLLWQPSDSEDAQTRVTVTTDSGAELWSSSFDPEYQFANGIVLDLGPPLGMWVADDNTVILHRAGPQMELFLRVLDESGISLGVARLTDVDEFPPVAIVNDGAGGLKLLTYDQDDRHVYELAMTFVDVADFDPDAGGIFLPDGGLRADASIPIDVDIAQEIKDRVTPGCCATVNGSRQTSLAAILLAFALIWLRRREFSHD